MNDPTRAPRIGLERVVELGQRHLGVDVAYIAETNATGQTCRAAAGDAASTPVIGDGESGHPRSRARRRRDAVLPAGH
jgi:hypothetical protein